MATPDADGWHDANEAPTERGWYECLATDDRWGGETAYRAWGCGTWWTPLKDGWLSAPMGLYRWRGPVADVMGPAPDGTDPRPTTAAAAPPARP
jgi:hypothetical protein